MYKHPLANPHTLYQTHEYSHTKTLTETRKHTHTRARAHIKGKQNLADTHLPSKASKVKVPLVQICGCAVKRYTESTVTTKVTICPVSFAPEEIFFAKLLIKV